MHGIVYGLSRLALEALQKAVGTPLSVATTPAELLVQLEGGGFAFATLNLQETGPKLIRQIRSLERGGDVVVAGLWEEQTPEATRATLRAGADFVPAIGIAGDRNLDEIMRYVHLGTQAALRRAGGTARDDIIQFEEEVLVEMTNGNVFVNGIRIPLTRSEWICLKMLIERAGVTLDKATMMRNVYEAEPTEDGVPNMKILDVFICKIRSKLNKPGAPEGSAPFGKRCIETVWGRGYIWSLKRVPMAQPTLPEARVA